MTQAIRRHNRRDDVGVGNNDGSAAAAAEETSASASAVSATDSGGNDDDNRGGGGGGGDGMSATTMTTTTTSDARILPIRQTNLPMVACAILASITTGGTTYAFGLYGGALKKGLNLTQSQLDTISAVFFSAGLFSFAPGAIVDRYGARTGMIAGGFSGAVCLMLFWAVAKGMVLVPSSSSSSSNNDDDDDGANSVAVVVAVLSALNAGIFLSCALVTGSVFKVISCHCGPGTKGSAVGAAKGFVGLGSGAYACLFQSLRTPGETSDLDFLPLCAFFFVTAACFPAWMCLPRKDRETAGAVFPDVFSPLHFRVLYASLALLAVLIIGEALMGLRRDDDGGDDDNDDRSPNYATAGLLLFVWIAPIVSLFYLPRRVPGPLDEGRSGGDDYEQVTLLRETGDDDDETEGDGGGEDDGSNIGDISLEPMTPREELREGSETADEEDAPDDEEEGSDDDEDDARGRTRRRRPPPPSSTRDKNLLQMLRTPSAWMMLWVTTVLCGAGTVETNNLGQMVESLGFSEAVTPATLAMFSVAQSGSRIVTGAASEAALASETRRCGIDRGGIPRPFFFLVASLAAILAHSILAVVTDRGAFVVGITLSGVAFGMIWPLMVLCVGEIFGTAHVGANYMFYDGFTSAAGTFVLSKMVAQRVYEEHIVDDDGSDGGGVTTCLGKECFQQTHVIIVALSVTCVAASLLMQHQTRTVYNAI